MQCFLYKAKVKWLGDDGIELVSLSELTGIDYASPSYLTKKYGKSLKAVSVVK